MNWTDRKEVKKIKNKNGSLNVDWWGGVGAKKGLRELGYKF